MVPSGVNFNSPEWGRMEEYLLVELADTHQRLSNPETTADMLRYLQGKVGCINHLLSLKEMAAIDTRLPPHEE